MAGQYCSAIVIGVIIMENLKVYYIKDDYINYLSKNEANCHPDGKSRVPFNKEQTRPYVGVIIERNDVNYFAPLASPKPKHQQMKNTPDVFKIKDGELGIINLNNMIPVKTNNIIMINLDDKPITYKRMVNDQLQFINNSKTSLLKKVEKLFKLYENNSIPRLTERCCNFTLLEKKCIEYNNGLLTTKFIEHTSREEAAATKSSDPGAVSVKDKVIDSYKKDFPPIKHISESAAQFINILNTKNGQSLTIKEIKLAYNEAGKNLENSDTPFNRKLFNEIDEIYSNLNQCKHKENQIQAHEKAQTSIQKNIVPEI